ncbi:MAG TPA: hypothetical protein VGP25_20750 [Gemmatimonadaceae bacterium]|jgi:hypothetical protein|nr:hypothetical protein [Gemmatimonadaceae bacterium]
MLRHTLAVLLILACSSTSPLGAQIATRPDELQPGVKVRVAAPGIVAGRYVGTVLSRAGDTLTVGSPNGLPFVLPMSRISSLEISRGKSHADGAVRGIKWGAPIGAAFGLVTMSALNDCYECSGADIKLSWVGLSTLSGVGYGALIGALIGRERWDDFDIPRHTAIGIHPGGASLALRYEF